MFKTFIYTIFIECCCCCFPVNPVTDVLSFVAACVGGRGEDDFGQQVRHGVQATDHDREGPPTSRRLRRQVLRDQCPRLGQR